MRKHYENQKAENARLTSLVQALRAEKSDLDMHLIDLERRMAEVELQVGAGDP